jgi:Flp pilus assembly protein TadD
MSARRALALVALAALIWPAPARAVDLDLDAFAAAPSPLRPELRDALYEEVEVLGEPVLSLRPSAEARVRLEALAKRRPGEAAVQRSLAEVLDGLGDHGAAATARRRAEKLGGEALWPLEDQADAAATRGSWSGQLGALKRLAARRQVQLKTPGERDRLAKVLRQIAETIEARQLPEDPLRYRRQAAELFPERVHEGIGVIRWLVEQGRSETALEQFPWARRRWPGGHSALALPELDLLFRLGRANEARAVFRREVAADDGLDSTAVAEAYVRHLRSRGALEPELRDAREWLRGEVAPSLELAEAVHLLEAAGHGDEAMAALDRAQRNVGAGPEAEQLRLAALLARVGRHDEAALVLTRLAATSRGPDRDVALLRLATLLAAGHGPVRPSALQALSEPGRLDPGPSVVGGVLSLLLGGPPGAGAARELVLRDARHARTAQASALLDDLAERRPTWDAIPALERQLIEAYRSFGANRTALEAAQLYLSRHPDDPAFFDVGLTAVELSRAAGQDPGMTIRALALKAAQRGDVDARHRVLEALERELGREGRAGEVVAAYWSAIDDHPDDVRLYNNLLRFLSRQGIQDEQGEVYRRALARFRGSDWASRYGRWLLRHRGEAADRALTRQLLDDLGPGELAAYLDDAVRTTSGTEADADAVNRLFLEIYREALRRHPGEIGIARRLCAFYDRRPDQYRAERTRLLVQYAPYDLGMRDALYAALAQTRSLPGAIGRLERSESTAGRLLAADFSIRRADPRAARAALASLAADLPGDRGVHLRLATLERSLGNEARAREIVTALLDRWPVDRELLTFAGELAYEQGDLPVARDLWSRIHESSPGDPGAYLHVAALFGERGLHADAASTLLAARVARSDDHLFGLELAEVHEAAGNGEPAIREYLRILADAARAAPSWPPPELARPGSDRDGPAPPREGLAKCFDRLAALATGPGSRATVEAVLRNEMAAAPDDVGLVHVRASLLEAGGRWDEADELLAEAALRLNLSENAASLQERAIGRLGEAGREQAVTAILFRMAQNRPLDLAPTLRLVDDLERRRHIASAAAALNALAGRLGDDESRRRDRLAVEIRLARLLHGNHRFEDAVAAAGRGLALARGAEALRLRVELGRWLVGLGRSEEAAATVAPALDEDPTLATALAVFADAQVEHGRSGGQRRQDAAAALVRTFEAALAATEAGAADRDEARRGARTLREQLIGRLTELEAHDDVLEQYGEALDDDLDDPELLLRAAAYAESHGLADELERRYQRAAERSPRDPDLPLVLARLAAARGDSAAATRHMERALTLAPERIDLRRELVDGLLREVDGTGRMEGWREAARQYRRMAELERGRGDTGSTWFAEEARMLGRLGDWAAMGAAVERLLDADPGDPAARLEAARLYAEAGKFDEAWRHARSYLEYWLGDGDQTQEHLRAVFRRPVGLEECMELAVRAGRWREAALLAGRLEQGWDAASRHPGVPNRQVYLELARLASQARTGGLARALRTYGVDHDVRGFVTSLRAALQASDGAQVVDYLAAAEIAAAAGSPRGHLDLLAGARRRFAGAERESALHESMQSLERWGAARELLDLVQHDGGALPIRERLAARLWAATVLGDPDAEEGALLALLQEAPEPDFDQRSVPLDRLLALRWQAGGEARRSISLLARPGAGSSGQVIDFLLRHGDGSGAREALERYGEVEGGSLWMDAARARVMVHQASRGRPQADHGPFDRALDLRPIGEQLDRPAKRGRVLEPVSWAQLARLYGEALARDQGAPRAGARRLEHAEIELDPRSASAQLDLGEAALRRSEPRVAAAHFRLARQLDPDGTRPRDLLARALLGLGQRDEALALWDQVLSACGDERCLDETAVSMAGAGQGGRAADRLARHLRQHWRDGGRPASLRLVRRLADLWGPRAAERGGPLDSLIADLWRLDRSRLDLLEAATGLGGRAPMLHGRARARALRDGLRELHPGSVEASRWVRAYAEALLEIGDHQGVVDLLDLRAVQLEAAGAALPLDLELARARGLLGLGRRDEALARLRGVAREEPEAAVRLLRTAGLPRESWELQLEAARARLERGQGGRAAGFAAVEALLRLDRAD